MSHIWVLFFLSRIHISFCPHSCSNMQFIFLPFWGCIWLMTDGPWLYPSHTLVSRGMGCFTVPFFFSRAPTFLSIRWRPQCSAPTHLHQFNCQKHLDTRAIQRLDTAVARAHPAECFPPGGLVFVLLFRVGACVSLFAPRGSKSFTLRQSG